MMDARKAYRENAAHGASAVGQVVLLYEQMVEDLRRAKRAVEENNVEARTNAINHAMVIVSHLQNKLNFEVGGEVARNIELFYNMVRQRLLEAQLHGSREILEEQISLLLDLRDAWMEVDRAESAHSGPQLPLAPQSPLEPLVPKVSISEWKA